MDSPPPVPDPSVAFQQCKYPAFLLPGLIVLLWAGLLIGNMALVGVFVVFVCYLCLLVAAWLT